MALPVTIPNEFANATASIPLSQLDTNFNTLANAVNGISSGSETLANASVTVLTAGTVDINGGAIDGTTVGTSNAAAGSFTTLNTSGAVVFNDAGADVDFRVESDTDANAFFLDGATGAIGLGVTPEAWVGYKVLQAGIGSFIGGSSGAYILSDNAYTDDTGASWKYINSSYAPAQYYAAAGAHVWRTAASGTADNTISWSESMRIDSSGNLLFNSGYGSAATAYGCRAWVHFRGTSTVLIYGSGNVSSITDDGTGRYTVNFTNAMPDTTYAFNVTGITQSDGGSAGYGGSVLSTTAIGVTTAISTGYVDYSSVSVTIHR